MKAIGTYYSKDELVKGVHIPVEVVQGDLAVISSGKWIDNPWGNYRQYYYLHIPTGRVVGQGKKNQFTQFCSLWAFYRFSWNGKYFASESGKMTIKSKNKYRIVEKGSQGTTLAK